jgi:hypothetical protein
MQSFYVSTCVQENVHRCLDTGPFQLGAGPEVWTPGLAWLLQEPGATDRTWDLSGRQIFTAVEQDPLMRPPKPEFQSQNLVG